MQDQKSRFEKGAVVIWTSTASDSRGPIPAIIIRSLTASEADDEVGPMYRIGFETGAAADAFQDELTLATPLNAFQRTAARAYAAGDFSHVTTLEEAKTQGDTLFAFVMIELGAGEDCDSAEEARQRIGAAIRELTHVYAALKGKDNTQPETPITGAALEGYEVTRSEWSITGGGCGVSYFVTTPEGARLPDDYGVESDAWTAAEQHAVQAAAHTRGEA